MSDRKMPAVSPPPKMDAALDVLIHASAHSSTPNMYHGYSEIYIDPKRSISYKSRWHLKTEDGARARQMRETIQFLKDLRLQIDDVLAKIETVPPNDSGMICVESYVYQPRKRDVT